MAWNPFTKIKERFSGRPAEDAGKAAPANLTDLKDLEKQGMLGKFFRHWKNPAFLNQMKALAARMQAEGVDLKDRKAVQAWMEKHKDDIAAGRISGAPAGEKPQTYVKTGPETGRNDPCPCGSGKKFKKCCGK